MKKMMIGLSKIKSNQRHTVHFQLTIQINQFDSINHLLQRLEQLLLLFLQERLVLTGTRLELLDTTSDKQQSLLSQMRRVGETS